mmetsp:Transcript_60519/g.163041  ORF Transcript_60519/g.163041 Transcript_60519/m.163041 type:complete len:145 (-) Transcript_60519:398-832(-)
MALADHTTSSVKAMKAMKAKRVSKIAKGRMAKALVLRGSKEKTVGGLRKDSLMKNARGRVVSKRASANGKRRYKNIETWIESVLAARKALHVSGFVAINGKTLQGKALYLKSKAIRAARQSGVAESSSSSSAAAPASSPAKTAA